MDPARLALYRSLAPLDLLSVDGAEILAAAHPGLAPAGTLSQPAGDPAGFRAAIAAGETWLLERGCTRALGPMEVSTWFPYRVKLGPHDYPTFLGEPSASPEPWLEAGYAPVADYHSTLVPHEVADRRYARAERQVEASGYTLRSLRPDALEDELGIFWRLSHAVFAEAYAFVPLPFEVFRAIYAPYHRLMDPRQVCVVEAPGGEPAAFFLNYPGPESPAGRAGVYKTMAVHPDFRGQGLAQALTARGHRMSRAVGLEGGMIHALMYSQAKSSFMAAAEGVLLRRYALLGKDLERGEHA